MRWFRQSTNQISASQPPSTLERVDLPTPQETIVMDIHDRTNREVREKVDKCLNAYCKDMGLMPKDVRHRLVDYEAERKVWTEMKMRTIYEKINDPDKLSLVIYLDTRMTEEEEKMIDEMSFHELMAFCQSENPDKLTQFYLDKEQMTKPELAARAKYDLRLSIAEIKARGTYANMARYWCKVRPEAFTSMSRVDLMRLYRD